MRKKTFLKAVALFACLSILMLSVPGAIASERTGRKTYTRDLFVRMIAMFLSFLPPLNLNTTGDTPSATVSNDDSDQEVKITAGKMKAMLGDDD